MLTESEICNILEKAGKAKYRGKGNVVSTIDVVPLLRAQEGATRREILRWNIEDCPHNSKKLRMDCILCIRILIINFYKGKMPEEK